MRAVAIDPAEIGEFFSAARLASLAEDSETAVIKSTHANIIVIGSSSQAENESNIERTQIISRLGERYPSRIFIVDCDRTEGELVEAKVRSSRHQPRTGGVLYSDEIYLSLTRPGIAALPNLVLANLVSDVPTIVVFLGDLVGSAGEEELGELNGLFLEIISHLGPWIERLIFDSGSLQSYQGAIDLFRSAGASLKNPLGRNNFRIFDLNWNRLSGLREVVAELFDSDEISNPAEEIEEIVCSFSTTSSAPPADLFIVICWMVHCLGWRIVDCPSPEKLTCRTREGEKRILRLKALFLSAQSAGLTQENRVLGIEFLCSDRRRSVELGSSPGHWFSQVSKEEDSLERSTLRREACFEAMVVETIYSSERDLGQDRVIRMAPKVSQFVEEALKNLV